jgi:hypothetical protein
MAKKAITLINQLLADQGSAMPPHVKDLNQRLIKIIDKTIHDDSDKDTLATVGVLALAPAAVSPLLLSGLSTLFSSKVDTHYKEILSLKPGDRPSCEAARIVIANRVASYEHIIHTLKQNPIKPEKKPMLEQFHKNINKKDRFQKCLEFINSRALHLAYLESKATLNNLLSNLLSNDGAVKPPKNTRLKKRGGNLDF